MKASTDIRKWINHHPTRGYTINENQQFYDVEAGLTSELLEVLLEEQAKWMEVQDYLAEVYEMRRGGRHGQAAELELPKWVGQAVESRQSRSEAGSKLTSPGGSRKRGKTTSTKPKASNSGSQSSEDTGAKNVVPEKS